jgi:3-isopropylmalate dehydrogenase
VGILPGEGIGPEVLNCALRILKAVLAAGELKLIVEYGGPIGRKSEEICGDALPADVVKFCQKIFERGGAILNGPGGGRYVYDLRREFDLFFKISPLQGPQALVEASPLKPEKLAGLDLLVVRENSGGVYQGDWAATFGTRRVATHRFEYTHDQVERFLDAAARLAKQRRGQMTVVWKESGVPAISRLWRDCAEEAAAQYGAECTMVDVDLMTYRLIQEPATFDVLATPNLFGDVLGDLGAVLLGSRGVSFSGNYNAQGHAVYQTNHGAAYDLAGTDRANPIGQIYSMSMMLRESFGLREQADAIEQAVRSVWSDGWRTQDTQTPGSRVVGTQQMGELIAERVVEIDLKTKSAA